MRLHLGELKTQKHERHEYTALMSPTKTVPLFYSVHQPGRGVTFGAKKVKILLWIFLNKCLGTSISGSHQLEELSKRGFTLWTRQIRKKIIPSANFSHNEFINRKSSQRKPITVRNTVNEA